MWEAKRDSEWVGGFEVRILRALLGKPRGTRDSVLILLEHTKRQPGARSVENGMGERAGELVARRADRASAQEQIGELLDSGACDCSVLARYGARN